MKLQLDRMGDGKFVLDTGSGSVTLVLPENPSARIVADTGSGSIRVELDGVEYDRKKRDYVELTVGDGDARVSLDTGSGSITVRQR